MYSNRDLEDYFAEYLDQYSFDDIRALLVVLKLEKGFGEQAPTIHDKSRLYKYSKSLDLIERDLDPMHNEIEAIEKLRQFITKKSSTKEDIVNEVEKDFAEYMDDPLFIKLLQDARNYIKQ